MNIEAIQFGILSSEEILSMSVADLTSTKFSGYGSVYDERMGSMLKDKCASCGMTKMCPGHIGSISLNVFIPHPLLMKKIIYYLKCYCIHCSSLLISPEMLLEVDEKNPESDIIQVICAKVSQCPSCGLKNGTISLTSDTNLIEVRSKTEECITLSYQNIFHIFDNVKPCDIDIFTNTKNFHPRNLIIRTLPVLPPCSRPFVVTDSTTSDDDLTTQYIEIIKHNNTIKKMKELIATSDIDSEKHEAQIRKSSQIIYFRISTLFNNSNGKAKHTSNRRKPLKGIKERITGKNGLTRQNLMGKRCEETGRTVIGADPYLRSCEVGVPYEMTLTLTVPERVNRYNIDALRKLIDDGNAQYVLPIGARRSERQFILKSKLIQDGDLVIRDGEEIASAGYQPGDLVIRNGEVIEPTESVRELKIGEIVERRLRTGDSTLMNRQPTLHTGSMIKQKARILPGKTLRLNLALTKSFNADH